MHILISANIESGAEELVDLCMAKMLELGASVMKDIHGDTIVVTTTIEHREPDEDDPSPEVTTAVQVGQPDPAIGSAEPPQVEPELPPEPANPAPYAVGDSLILSLSTTQPVKTIVDPTCEHTKLLVKTVQFNEDGSVMFDFAGFSFNMTRAGSADVINPNNTVDSTTVRLVMRPGWGATVAAYVDITQSNDILDTLVIGKDLMHLLEGETTADVPAEQH